eukprot:m.311756 g.311756  ORF g.311756 m.311756 type:complete len:50 (+) comp15961_c0_seq1:11-160(+)
MFALLFVCVCTHASTRMSVVQSCVDDVVDVDGKKAGKGKRFLLKHDLKF